MRPGFSTASERAGTTRRILYIETGEAAGGSGLSLLQLLQNLDRRRYEPLVLFYYANEHLERFERAGIPTRILRRSRPARAITEWARRNIQRSPRPSWRTYGAALIVHLFHVLPACISLWRLMRRERFDLVHLNDKLRAHRDGILAARLAGIPVVCHERAVTPLNRLDRFLARWVKRHICISDWVRSYLLAQGLESAKARRVYNGFDFHGATPARLATSGGAVRDIAMVGRIEPWKGQAIFLQALARARRSHPELRGWIAGTATAGAAPYRAKLEDLSRRLGLQGWVHFAGYVGDIPAWLADKDILVHCSIEPEPFGRVILEGLAAGAAVISTTTGGGAEILRDGIDGLLVPSGDPAALATAIETLVDDPGRARALVCRGSQRARRIFPISDHARRIAALYEEILA